MVTDTLTNMPHNDPAQYTVLGWVKTKNKICNVRYCRITYCKMHIIMSVFD